MVAGAEDDIVQAVTHGCNSAGLRQLAMNCSSSVAAEAALQCLPATATGAALLDPGVAGKLLLTAAARQHATAVQHMLMMH
uniref:Uncharacterized protein n=1 Tax=Tetradesmus obliquus TaxID=3088 RepID=A0A383WAC5_TETOB